MGAGRPWGLLRPMDAEPETLLMAGMVLVRRDGVYSRFEFFNDGKNLCKGRGGAEYHVAHVGVVRLKGWNRSYTFSDKKTRWQILSHEFNAP